MHRIVIVGGGVGGLELATRLGKKLGRKGKAEVVLIDKNTTHVWKPYLHEVAVGTMDPSIQHLDFAAHGSRHHFRYVQGELRNINKASKYVTLSALTDPENHTQIFMPERTLSFDSLVLALGSTTHFFNVPGAAEYAIALDSVQNAERLRRRLVGMKLRVASNSVAGSATSVHVAVIGGGATGVELSAALIDMSQLAGEYEIPYSGPPNNIAVTLVEAGPRILPALPETLSKSTHAMLNKMEVRVSVGDPVVEIRSDEVITKSGQRFHADIIVWAAGVRAPAILGHIKGLSLNKLGQIVVEETLQCVSASSIFALGDCACCPSASGESVPPRAQVARQQAAFLASAIEASLSGQDMPKFRYRDLGSLVCLGSEKAIGMFSRGKSGKKVFVKGVIARVMYSLLYRFYVASVAGVPSMILRTIAEGVRRRFAPKVKLH